MVPILVNLALGNINYGDLVLGNCTLGNFNLFSLTLGNLSQCSPAFEYDTMGPFPSDFNLSNYILGYLTLGNIVWYWGIIPWVTILRGLPWVILIWVIYLTIVLQWGII